MNDRNVITQKNPKSPTAEAYRTLRTNIQFSNIDKEVNTIAVTSSGPSEGKSTTTANLAVTMAQTGKKVLLIDCDLRKPRIHELFGLSNLRGLTNILTEDIELEQAIQNTETDNLEILSSGIIPPNPSEILGSQKMEKFLNKLKESYDVILLDTPPVNLVTDAAVLANKVDGTILVCAVGQASIEEAKNSKALLEKVNANILGVVLNKVPIKQSGYYRYQYS
ncbi:CpsD/CapB family tyrosine-protein kinase [Sporosalibacterium faouarense]|uniref:CpsD/CapB family tyrosine-protein kinase n=1 Tax=Sporosalibacterium faouarense TaxID=516123 RepID=UPI00141D22E9|nr:CpsD/CapB family tyrosine-protein kinase [Sporosalibacterium faouarense]MTI46822.1 CpsD/CapB family tyrosine-protein kinase [Bacillota bacterium]